MSSLLVLGLLAFVGLTYGRQVVPFRYGWRFHYAPGQDDAPGPGHCTYTDISNQ